jgi:hypothetical protein
MYVEINGQWMRKVMVCGCRNGRDTMKYDLEWSRYTCPHCNTQVGWVGVIPAGTEVEE